MTKQADYTYDVFISYSHSDKEWVRGELLPRLEQAGLRVCIDDRDFEIGVPSLVNMERAVDNSRHTLVVLTPAWIASEWTEFESLLVQTDDPAARRRRLIPLRLKPCHLPKRIAMLTYLDFTSPADRDWQRLLKALGSLGKQDPERQPATQPHQMSLHKTVDYVEQARHLLEVGLQVTPEQSRSVYALLNRALDLLQEQTLAARTDGNYDQAVLLDSLSVEISSARVELRGIGNIRFVRTTQADLEKLESVSRRLRVVLKTLEGLVGSQSMRTD